MNVESLLRLAEDNHLRLAVVFNPGHDPNRPGRGYTVLVGDDEANTGPRGRLDEAVQAAIGVAFARVATLQDELEAATVPKGK